MKRFGAFVVLTACLTFTAHGFEQDQARRASISDFGWMSGCWKQDRGEGSYVYEQWSKPAGLMVGLGRVHRDGRIVEYEFLRIEEKGEAIYFIAIPFAQQEAAFRLTSFEDGVAVFENPEHDFPQKISYSRTAGGMTARVEGTDGGSTRGFEVVFARAACEG